MNRVVSWAGLARGCAMDDIWMIVIVIVFVGFTIGAIVWGIKTGNWNGDG